MSKITLSTILALACVLGTALWGAEDMLAVAGHKEMNFTGRIKVGGTRLTETGHEAGIAAHAEYQGTAPWGIGLDAFMSSGRWEVRVGGSVHQVRDEEDLLRAHDSPEGLEVRFGISLGGTMLLPASFLVPGLSEVCRCATLIVDSAEKG